MLKESAASSASYASSGGLIVVGGLTLNDIGILVGIACAIFTAATNFWFKRRREQREIAQAYVVADDD